MESFCFLLTINELLGDSGEVGLELLLDDFGEELESEFLLKIELKADIHEIARGRWSTERDRRMRSSLWIRRSKTSAELSSRSE